MRTILLLFITALSLQPCLPAESKMKISLRAEVEPSEILIGDPFRLKLKIDSPDGVAFSLPELKDGIEPFVVTAREIRQEKSGKNGAVHKIDLSMTAFEIGTATIPSITVNYETIGGGTGSLKTPEIPLSVYPVKPTRADKKRGDIRDIKGPEAPFPAGLFLTMLFLISAAAAAYVIYRKKMSGRNGAAPETPPVPPYMIAYAKLEELNKRRLPDNGLFKDFYSRLSDIIREYIDKQLDVPAIDKTTTEIASELRRKNNRATREITPVIKGLFEDCDLVKFAKFIPEKPEAEKAFEDAKKIIDMTAPKQQDPQNNRAGGG